MSMQENFGQGLENTGNFIFWSGMVGIGIMAVVGTVLIDVVVIASLFKSNEESRKSHREHCSHDNPFFTYMLWSMFFSNRGSSHDSNFGVALLISPITTAIAVGLSFYLGVPVIGLAALAGWGLALALTGVGYGLSQLGQHIKEDAHLPRDRFFSPHPSTPMWVSDSPYEALHPV